MRFAAVMACGALLGAGCRVGYEPSSVALGASEGGASGSTGGVDTATGGAGASGDAAGAANDGGGGAPSLGGEGGASTAGATSTGGTSGAGGANDTGGTAGTGGTTSTAGTGGTTSTAGTGGTTSTGGGPGTCVGPSDCTSGVCSSNVCQDPTCSDGVPNQDETDVDCGGSCGATCEEDDTCKGSGDCSGAACVGGVCDACPGDADIDGDRVCDAEDLEQRAFVAGVTRPSLSSDGRVLFAISSDQREVRAYDVQVTPSIALTPRGTVTVAAGLRVIKEVFALDATRVAVTLTDALLGDVQWLKVYDLQGSTFTLVEDIDTLSNRIYDVKYDSVTDRLYWSNYLIPPVYSYTLATTPLGYLGLGSSVLPFTRLGGYGLHFQGSRLFKVSGSVEIGDLSSGSVITSWGLSVGVGGAIGQNSVAVTGGALLFTTYFGLDVRFIIEDISALPSHASIANIQLAPLGSREAHFVLRGPKPVAVVATAGQAVRVFDLSTLPAPPAAPRALPASVLGGNAALGFLDCDQNACFVAASTGIYALAP